MSGTSDDKMSLAKSGGSSGNTRPRSPSPASPGGSPAALRTVVRPWPPVPPRPTPPSPPYCPAVDWNPQTIDVGGTRYFAGQTGSTGVICGYDRDERQCPPSLRECANRPSPVNVNGGAGSMSQTMAMDPVCMTFDPRWGWQFSRASVDPYTQTARCPSNGPFF